MHQLTLVGAGARLVRLPRDLKGLDALIIPGGETTTMDIMLDRHDLREAVTEFAKNKPVWGTCAGMIMLAKGIEDNQSGVKPLGLMDIDVVRNGYGRQIFSFEDTIKASLGNGKINLTGTFIRAPKVTRVGPKVQVMSTFKGSPVLVRQGRHLASSFHTELDDDTTLLEYFLSEIA
jgi:5'-phosphate synthase pdxT subunit